MKNLLVFLYFLSFFVSTNDVLAQETLNQKNYKYLNIKNICQKIIQTQGTSLPMPQLIVYSTKSQKQVIAQYKAMPQPTIFIDEKLYNLCQTFGADSLHALSCVIGHELAHYFEKHTWHNGFTGLVQGSQNDTHIEKTEKVRLETRADDLGLFHAFLAGYDAYALLPKVLETIYQSYQLPSQLEGYPSKNERIDYAKKTVQKLQPLVAIYQSAELLFVQKQYAEASALFQYILQTFPSKEIYQNIGACQLAQAATYFTNQEMYFAFPFEFDASSRLQTGLTRHTEILEDHQEIKDNVQIRKELLQQAKANLKQALSLDNHYESAYHNLACVYILEQNYELAIGLLNEWTAFLNEQKQIPSGNTYLLRGIARIKNNQPDKAEADFQNAFQRNAYMKEYNMALFEKLQKSWTKTIYAWLGDWTSVEDWIQSWFAQRQPPKPIYKNIKNETICSQNIGNIMQINWTEEQKIVQNNINIKINYQIDNQCFKSKIKLFDKEFFILSSPSQTSLKKYATEQDLLRNFGSPTYLIPAQEGTVFYIYEPQNLIVKVQQGRAKNWTLYKLVYQ
jgi:Tfp pilus assembly protein PilF